MCSYRLVSLTCEPCNLLEHSVCSNSMANLGEHNFYQTDNMLSCETQLTMVINYWAEILDNKGQVNTFTFDFEKSFDTPLMNSLKVN